jgi:hypothetical protein
MNRLTHILQHQTNTLDTLGNLMHHDAITGTSPNKVIGDFMGMAQEATGTVHKLAGDLLVDKIYQNHGVTIAEGKLDPSMEYWATPTDYTSPYSHAKQFMFVIQNPSA